MPTDQPSARAARPLVVIAAHPASLTRWLAPAVRDLITFEQERPTIHVDDVLQRADGSPRRPLDGLPEGVILPLDAPDTAVELAADWLRTNLPADALVIPAAPGGGPPNPRSVRVLTDHGVHVGIDVDRCDWTTSEGMWVPGQDQVHHTTIDWDNRTAVSLAAQLLHTQTTLELADILIDWLDAVGHGHRPAGRDDWTVPLQVLFLSSLVQH